jgi:DNA-binding MarR family transcriptional regulator
MHMKEAERRALAEHLKVSRRAMVREVLVQALVALGEADLTLQQLGALVLLEEGGPRSVKEISELLGRSASATSRLIDQLVRRRLLRREEDREDRRARRVSLSERGRRLVDELMARRAEAQLGLMERLAPEERAVVMRAYALMAEAAERRKGDGA